MRHNRSETMAAILLCGLISLIGRVAGFAFGILALALMVI